MPQENKARVAVMTDSNSGMTQQMGEMYGITVAPMSFTVNGTEYLEGVSLSREEFLETLKKGADVMTSQAAPGFLLDKWDELLKEYDQVIYIPMSSAISGSTQSAMSLAAGYDGRVQVADNHRISVTQMQSVFDAAELAKRGLSAEEIKEYLEKTAYDASIYLAVNTLEYLKKSGRVTAAGAAVASVLNIKPILQIQGEKLDAFAKARGMKAAQDKMLEAIKNDMETRFAGCEVIIRCAHSADEETGEKWREKIAAFFPEHEIKADALSMNICCHTGEGALGIGCIKKMDA